MNEHLANEPSTDILMKTRTSGWNKASTFVMTMMRHAAITTGVAQGTIVYPQIMVQNDYGIITKKSGFNRNQICFKLVMSKGCEYFLEAAWQDMKNLLGYWKLEASNVPISTPLSKLSRTLEYLLHNQRKTFKFEWQKMTKTVRISQEFFWHCGHSKY